METMETNKFEKFLMDNYNSEVVEESSKRSYVTKERLNIDFIVNKVDKNMWDKLTMIFEKIINTSTRYAFLDGAKFATEKRLQSIYRHDCPSFMKDRKLWIMIDFGDNDFSLDMEHAGMFYADIYNRHVDHVTTCQEDMISDYMKMLDEFEKPDIIMNILKNGYVHGLIGYETSCLPSKTSGDIENQADENLKYLGIRDNIKVFKTENDVLEHIKDAYSSIQGDGWDGSIKDLWCNGECLVMWLDDGTMHAKVI